ncbi:Asp-tRNA(Asn)/Glu-tRNA(Gln) amidotransferase subunit GatA [Candidatus Falkowbacteria bacterium]|jgi:aspartyl-tRNA(Asn)/glutamyl-tRNA(Gln) amidotransferase subunit A|nr:Asp-tRNA(Asn)/Glu-tRNA(Gln) amidotransferase subunit GatA [Candidatus Falkowbacteria bacterium]MBT5503204.1 Asp-tRNA(Asn)/Glu-tRNA(Gln) amidotransferase subunit GatA [Candidatus Falkowbacteria bacterium]MBT6573889.1 Asp-tRNA(Asn)/Glu-tRNA(Gln) amidotransferase subunit GatA [Candidatus Falkowbacteria bacterium]MBT7348504.1 Asp-tRNA(Asn)/Glu-tRNA(Gln) amidotransferase subunit GatA [Candidatus Falkowbacteria bacterium]MBT7500831.1 Asp-tRNA(Asn)/Glu-tRNA(Gln) amidotransferase subunit GatA [Candi
MKLNTLTIADAHEGLSKKQFSAVELAKSCFDSIREQDNDLNAFITITEDQAYTQAEKVDKKFKKDGKLNVLEGVPVAIKDNIMVDGVKATAGSKILSTYIATYDATAIRKLKDQGAVIIGKTNCDEFAMGGSGETSHFGPTKNPHNLEKVPGGSSSGSAAAVAANEAIYALGSDTGGSVRQPGSLCGVVGFKPTYGRTSRYGLMAMASSFDQIGTLTKTVKDAAYVYEKIAGLDKFDSTTVDKQPLVINNLEKDIKGLKIGIPSEYFIKGMDPEVEKVVKKAISKLSKLGAELVDISLPRTKYALATYYVLMPAEVSSNLARYDGVRYGYRAEAGNLLEMYLESRRKGFGEEARRRIMLGTYVLSSGYYDAYYKKAQQVRRLIKEDFDQAFEMVDCIVTPTSPTVAFNIGEKFDDPLTMYLSDVFTVSANVAGLPGISIPCGQVKKLPVGLQFLGKHFDEQTLLNVAHQVEQII